MSSTHSSGSDAGSRSRHNNDTCDGGEHRTLNRLRFLLREAGKQGWSQGAVALYLLRTRIEKNSLLLGNWG